MELIEPYKEIWSKRYIGQVGLSESVGKLYALFKLLIPGSESDDLMSTQKVEEILWWLVVLTQKTEEHLWHSEIIITRGGSNFRGFRGPLKPGK